MKNKILVVALIAAVVVVIGVGVVYAQNNTTENRVRWEYDFLHVNLLNYNVYNLRGEMNQRGREGWEYDSMISSGKATEAVFVFKRRLQ